MTREASVLSSSRSSTRSSVRPAASAKTAGWRGKELWVIPLILLVTLIVSYWPTIVPLFKEWQNDDNYSVGQLVPLAALYLLWSDRKAIARCAIRPNWWGAVIILMAQAARIYGLVFQFESAERYSLVLTIVGLTLLVAGWQLFRRVFWILMLLFLMVPLPGRIHNMISGPLQGIATTLAVVTVELLGITVAREGHTMVLNDTTRVAVAEACSGLRMLTAFVLVSCVLAFIVNRPRWQKTVLVLSSVPVAILCNQIRLVLTVLLFLVADSQLAERFFHDFAGLTMMPMAVLMLVGELWIMSRLVVEDKPAQGQVNERTLTHEPTTHTSL